jgi:flagellar protein FlgJ
MEILALGQNIAAASQVAPKLQKLRKASQDVEAVFLKDLLRIMRQSVPKTDLGPQSMGKEIYEDLFDQAIAESASSSGNFGFGETLYQTLKPSVLRAAWAEAMKILRDQTQSPAKSQPETADRQLPTANSQIDIQG